MLKENKQSEVTPGDLVVEVLAERLARLEKAALGAPVEEGFDFKRAKEAADRAEGARQRMEKERDEARAELEKVKADVGWMMGQGLIADLIFKGDEVPLPAPHEMEADGKDRVRLEWLNKHGRVCMGETVFTVAFPHGGGSIGDRTLPMPYNMRHLIDLCRANLRGDKEQEQGQEQDKEQEGRCSL